MAGCRFFVVVARGVSTMDRPRRGKRVDTDRSGIKTFEPSRASALLTLTPPLHPHMTSPYSALQVG